MNGLPPFHLTIGIDPGASGAIALLHDGVPVAVHDMPVLPRKTVGEIVDGAQLAAMLRGALHGAHGAAVLVVLEQVGAMPKQGVASTFKFGQSDGIARGVIAALGLPLVEVTPQRWKKRFGLGGTEKDVARATAIQRFPQLAAALTRKKDCGRADAALMGAWGYQVEQMGDRKP